jgi:hypothetical protein
VTPPRTTGDLGYAAGRGLDEDHAESLLFEPGPASTTVHHHHVGRSEPGRELLVGHPTKKLDRGPASGGEPIETTSISPRTPDLYPHGETARLKEGRRLNESVHTLARDETGVGDDQEVFRANAPALSFEKAIFVVEGAKAEAVDPGRHLNNRRGPLGGVSSSFIRAVLTGGDRDTGVAKNVAQARGDEGNSSGNRDLGSVQHDAVGLRETRSEESEGPGGIEKY